MMTQSAIRRDDVDCVIRFSPLTGPGVGSGFQDREVANPRELEGIRLDEVETQKFFNWIGTYADVSPDGHESTADNRNDDDVIDSSDLRSVLLVFPGRSLAEQEAVLDHWRTASAGWTQFPTPYHLSAGRLSGRFGLLGKLWPMAGDLVSPKNRSRILAPALEDLACELIERHREHPSRWRAGLRGIEFGARVVGLVAGCWWVSVDEWVLHQLSACSTAARHTEQLIVRLKNMIR